MSEPKRFHRLPLEVTAFELTQFGDFVRATAWVNDNGGNASFAQGEMDHMILATPDGISEGRVGTFVVWSSGGFTLWDGETFINAHEPLPEDNYDEGLTGTGQYVVGRPDGRTSLVGGAALPLPT